MCLVFVAHRSSTMLPLVIAANRDEFLNRPSAPAAYWEDDGRILGGRDLREGGGWFAWRQDGRWAAVTNYRDPRQQQEGRRSRGAIVHDFLSGAESIDAFVQRLRAERELYNPFNVLLGDNERALFYGSSADERRELGPGIYGLSNASLDTPWPKVQSGKKEVGAALAEFEAVADREAALAKLQQRLLSILADEIQAPEADLPSTGIPAPIEKALSARFIRLPGYGTRASTVALRDAHSQLHFLERSFADGEIIGERSYRLSLVAASAASAAP